MTVIRQNRRQFLRGVGGFTLALPFLPSLVEKAHAQTFTPLPRMVMMATGHGAASNANMFPAANTPFEVFSDHVGRQSALVPSDTAKGRAKLSPVMTAPSELLTSKIASKLNALRGIDMPFYQGHHTGGYLGNHARFDGENEANNPVTKNIPPRPTIDQIMAWSPNFYKDLSINRLRSMHIGREQTAFGWANPSTRAGAITRIPSTWSSKDLFDSIFVASQATTSTRSAVVDQVLESYRRLTSGAFGDAHRISASDRVRLGEHMDRINELQRKLSVVASCGDVVPPSKAVDRNDPGVSYETVDFRATIQWYKTFNDVIVAAFICGTSRIATINSVEQWSPYSGGNWHQNIAHTAAGDPNAQVTITEAHRQEFESLFLDLVTKLDIEEADGKTYLDNSLVWWTQESGHSTHDPISVPIITAGSAAGFFKTGYSVDYRRLEGPKWNNSEYGGLLYSQWLANVLQSMGVPRSEYALSPTDKGYGNGWRQADYGGDASKLWPDRLFAMADSKLPFITT